jgi:fatty acid kinase fatty acid binding subunit
MDRVAIVTDSSANLPPELIHQWDISVVPALLVFGGNTFHDGLDVTPGELYRWLRTNKRIPTTSAPSIGDFVRVYAALSEKAAGIVSIHPPASLTAIYSTAVAASQLIDEIPIRVISSNAAAMGQGFVVLEAARAAAAAQERGDPVPAAMDAIAARAAEVASRVNLMAAIDTLEYLYRGGRIGGAAALLGSALQIKPIVYIANGRVEVLAKPRTKSKATQFMLKQMAGQVDSHRLHAAVLHADAPEEAEALRQRIAQEFDCVELYTAEFTPVMGAHTGPGLVGVAFFAEDGDADDG